MKINQIINETTTSGAVASVAQPMGAVKTRSNKKAGSMFTGKTTSKPFYEAEINEEDRIMAPGKGNKIKPGLLSKPEQSMNPVDSVKIDVPLLIRLLEYAREDASSDVDLHNLAEKLVARGSRGRLLTMKDYSSVVEGFTGALAGGVIGAAVTKTPQGAMTGASLGSKVQNALGEKQVNELAVGYSEYPSLSLWTGVAKKAGHKVSQQGNEYIAVDKFGNTAGRFNIGKSRGFMAGSSVNEGDKVDRMVKHVAKSEKKLGHSKKEAENIAWATANKRGMLDNKNKKK